MTYGSVLTSRNTVSSAAKTLESQGYRVVAGINGDFYNVGNGLPIALSSPKDSCAAPTAAIMPSDSGLTAPLSSASPR